MTLSVSPHRGAAHVYAFISDPRNLPEWATAFVRSVRQHDGEWFLQTDQGELGIRFVEQNPLGVADHFVRVAPGVEVYNALRVLPNGDGSEVLFTMFQQPGQTDEQFLADQELVRSDLATLKRVLG